MDLSAILPMLMNKGNSSTNGNDQLQTVLKAMSNGGGGGKPDLAAIMNLANMNKKPDKNFPVGLKVIAAIAPNDILGLMIKYFTNHQ